MNRLIALIVVLTGTCIASNSFADSPGSAERFWGQWRGPLSNGVAPNAKPPTEWSETKNVRWKSAIPGHGLSTPIVWGDLVFVQTAVPEHAKSDSTAKEAPPADQPKEPEPSRDGENREGRDRRDGQRPRDGQRGGGRPSAPTEQYRFSIVALDRKTGKTVWERTVRNEVPHEGSHQDGSLAAASPLTDGEHVFAFFGSRGLYCLTMKGEPVWEKDLGDMKTRNGFGEGSSPALHGDTLIVNWDHEAGSFIVALDKATGAEKWRRERDEVTSWATPLILPAEEPAQVIVAGTNRVRSYELKTGKVIWECGGLGANCIPVPVSAFGQVYVMSGHRDPALLAIRYKGATGDLTGSNAVVWKLDKGTPYVPSPILYDDLLCFLQKSNAILSCHDARTGDPRFTERLDDINGVYASPVGAADHIYVTGRNGVTYVLKKGSTFQVAAVNRLDDEISASPAIVGNQLFLRGNKSLYCIAAD